ncbi:MAG: hypothetical protein AAB289_14380, partial [Chloroflexota bacterium]
RLFAIYVIVEERGKTGSLEFNYGTTTPTGRLVISPSPTYTPRDITVLPGRIARVAPPANPSTVVAIRRGAALNFTTRPEMGGSWAGVGVAFDDFGTPEIETRDLSAAFPLIIGLKGSIPDVKLELIDAQDRKVAVSLSGISPTEERVFAIPLEPFRNQLDLTRVRVIYVIVETPNRTGTLEFTFFPETAIPPSPTHTPKDITILPGTPQIGLAKAQGNPSTLRSSARGLVLFYDTTLPDPRNWAGAGVLFSPVVDLSGSPQLIIGLKGDVPGVRLEFIDQPRDSRSQVRRASVELFGISPTEERIFAIPLEPLRSQLDLTRLFAIYVIVEERGKTGSL